MSHNSIAIIRKKILENEDHSEYSYLVQSLGAGRHQFLNIIETAIGGGFDYSKLRRYVLKYLDLTNNKPVDQKDPKYYDLTTFVDVDVMETNKHSPYATPCVITLSEIQVQVITESIRRNEDDKWNSLKWIEEKDLQKLRSKWIQNQKFIFKKEDSFKIPDFPNELRVSLRNIVKARNSGKLVIFAGAGVSVDSLVPMWNELTEELRGDLDGEAKTTDNSLELAQLYFNSRGTKEYQERVQEILKYRKTEFNPIHQKVIQMAPCHIITTNFDEHFEQVLETENSVYSIIKKDSDLPYSTGNSLFIKMHGDFSERNIVLKAKDFHDYPNEYPLISGAINGIFASKLVLFIGYSFNDPNLEEIYNTTKNILGEDIQPPYFVTTSLKERPKKKLEGKYKFKILELNDKSKSAINSYFSQVASDDEETKMELLSEKGQDLYKLLSVIDKFDLILTTFDGKSVEKQLISSISRFSKFGAIPKQVIEQITPFKGKGKINNKLSNNSELRNDRDYHLKTPNEELLKFLKKEKGGNSTIDFYSFKKKQRSSRDQELDKVWKLLFTSGARCIIRKNDTNPDHFKLKPINITDETDDKCNCFKCRFDRFEWANLLMDLSNSSNKLICKNSFIDLDLDLAYGYMKTGQIIQAYYTLEEAKNLAIKQRDYVTYFLACYNQKKLRPFLWYSNSRFTDEKEFERISEQIDLIDLDKVLYEIPVDKDVRLALKIIRDDSLFEPVRITIEENLEKILTIHKKYESGGYRHSGPNYWHIIQYEFYSLWSFYHLNHLFNDSFENFNQLAEKFIEGMLASFATSNKYSGRLKEFSGFFVTIFILYSNPKTNLELLTKYNIQKIHLDIEAISNAELMNDFDSFIKSGYKETDFFELSILKNEQYSAALNSSDLFNQLNSKTLDNYLILLSHVDLTTNQINDSLANVLNYISVDENYSSGYGSLNALTHFLVVKVLEINITNLERSIIILIEKERFSKEIERVCNAIFNCKKTDSFLNHSTYKTLKHTYINSYKDASRFNLLSIYPLLKPEDKIDFFNLIEKEIYDGSDINDRLILKSYLWGIWNPKENSQIFEMFTDEILKFADNFPDFQLREDGSPIGINDFSVWNQLMSLCLMVYKFDLFDHVKIQQIRTTIKSAMFKFILNPNNYDYSKFDSKWVINFSNTTFLERMCNSQDLISELGKALENEYNFHASKIYFLLRSQNNMQKNNSKQLNIIN